MFKKPSEVKALQRLSGADRKKLRRHVKDKFMYAEDADLDLLLPAKAEVSVSRLANRVLVYAIEGGPPVLFDVDGRGSDIFPTVYALWKVPTLLPAFVLKGGEVSRYVLGGADLMFPGILIPPEGLPSFGVGEAWAIKVPGNECPIAVGSTAMSCAEASKANFRGKALHVLHFYRDSLWDSWEGGHVPNAGFLEDIVVEDPGLLTAHPVTEVSEAGDDELHSAAFSEPLPEHCEAVDSDSKGTDVAVSGVNSALSGLKVNEAEGDDAGTGPQISVEEMDALLDKCLLQALHTSVKDKELPVVGSTLWSGHILPCRPAGTVLDIKKSSHKKLSKWLASKASSGLIAAKEDKHRKEVVLQSINRAHPEYQAFRPAAKSVAAETPSPASAGTEGPGQVQLEVFEVWRPTPHVNKIFEAVGADTNKYFTASEASQVVFAYVEAENLVKPGDKTRVMLNATLCDALYKGTVKKGSTYPTEILKAELGAAFVSRMQANHRVVRGGNSVVRKGVLKSVQILTERRQGNKKVTRVSGMESFLVDADVLAAELQKKFACSTSVAELPGKKSQNEVLIQGGVLEDLAKHLVQHYGIPKRHIEILDKTKK